MSIEKKRAQVKKLRESAEIITDEAYALESSALKDMLNSDSYTADLSAYKGKTLSSVSAFDSQGSRVYLSN